MSVLPTGHANYLYTKDLLALNRCQGPAVTNPKLSAVSTPLNLQAWSASLSRHPDQRFTDYVITGLHNGFRIEADRSQPIHPAAGNMPSA